MNCKYKIFISAILFFFFSLSVNAQINALSVQNLASVNVDDISDAEIKTYFLKAKENQLSESDVYRILTEKGLPQAEIAKLEERLSKLYASSSGNGTGNDNTTSSKDQAKKSGRQSKQDFDIVPLQTNKSDLSIFGSELFTTNSTVFEPNLRIPTPSGYILGPDDELVINVFGYSEKTYNVTVNEEGNIYIPQVGPVFVNGLSIEQASGKIKSKLASTIYKAINGGQTRVQISLGKIRSIRVTVIGEAKKPGTYTISSLTTLFNVLYLCGGPSDLGSYRKIELIRGNELKRTVDLYGFLLRGNQKDNILLQEGDVVRIPYYQKRVLLNGSVKHKGKYELVEGESINNLFEVSGGFADNAYKASVTIYQLTDKERKIIDLSRSNFATYKPMSSDSIVVGQLLDRFENKLTIRGAIMRPGEYELVSGANLKELIEKAGGVKEDVYSKRGSISRQNTNTTPIQLSFDIDSVLKNLSVIPLKKNDSVTIYSIFDLENPIVVNIDGNIKRPGKYKWAENITLKDILLSAGGITESGDNKNIEIARRIDNINLTKLNHLQTEIINVDLSDSFSTNDIVLKPYDVINIRQKPGFTYQRTVFVEGMVLNPGRYTLKMSGDKISDVLKRAGGFSANADTTYLVIKRLVKKSQTLEERQKVFSKLLNINQDSINSTQRIKDEIYKSYDKISIDLYKALKSPNESENMLLEDGDVITVEQNSNLVKVSGEVYFPTIIPFKEGASLKYYIQKSGSYTQLARKSGALVIYPDGKAKKVRHFLFFKTYPEVVSRAEIFIPQKAADNKSRITLGEWSVILSSLAIIANVIINLRK